MLSKNMSIMKALIEECTRRRGASPSTEPRDIEVAIKCLKIMLELESVVYVIADSRRFCDAFQDVIEKQCVFLETLESVIGLEKGPVVCLHTGDRTEKQRNTYLAKYARLKDRPEIDMYHIGRWYA